MKIVGLSLSMCVTDIIEHRAELEEVYMIITNTEMLTTAQTGAVFDIYAKMYWRKNTFAARLAAIQLLDTNRLLQPRAVGLHHPMPQGNPNYLEDGLPSPWWITMAQYEPMRQLLRDKAHTMIKELHP